MVGQHIYGNIGEYPRKARTHTIDRIEARNCRQPFPATVVCVGCNRRGAKAHIHAGTLPAIVRVHRRNFYQCRMHPRQMVVLHKVFANQFPVRMDLILDAPRKPKLAQAITIQARRQIAELLGKRRRVCGKAHKHQTAPLCNAHRMQAHLSPVKRLDICHVKRRTLLHRHIAFRCKQRRAKAHAVQVIGPGMVRALKETLDTPRALAQARPAVPAHIMVRAQFTSRIARHNHRAPRHLHHMELPGRAHLIHHAHRHPTLRKHALLFQRVKLRRRVRIWNERGRKVHRQPGARVCFGMQKCRRIKRPLHRKLPESRRFISGHSCAIRLAEVIP